MGTIHCAEKAPDVGGDTTYASMTAAYEGLGDRMSHFVSGLAPEDVLRIVSHSSDRITDCRRSVVAACISFRFQLNTARRSTFKSRSLFHFLWNRNGDFTISQDDLT